MAGPLIPNSSVPNSRRRGPDERISSESVAEDDDKGGVASCVIVLKSFVLFDTALLEDTPYAILSSMREGAWGFDVVGLEGRRDENSVDGGVRVRDGLRGLREEALTRACVKLGS